VLPTSQSVVQTSIAFRDLFADITAATIVSARKLADYPRPSGTQSILERRRVISKQQQRDHKVILLGKYGHFRRWLSKPHTGIMIHHRAAFGGGSLCGK
jgi:hypothetical protein